MRTVGVTGGSGFIGTYVVEELSARGYRVVVFDRSDHRQSHEQQVQLGDIRDEVAVNEFAAHVDGIIHLAGVLGTQETVQNPIPAAHTNILGGLNVLQAATQYDVPLVNIAVGNHWMLNPYSLTKSTVEKFSFMYQKERGTSVSVVRALNAYGPRQVPAAPFGPSRVRKIMPSFVCRALTGQPIEVYGDGSQIMDMIFVEDVAFVLVQALEHTASKGAIPHVLEAGTGRDTTVLDIATVVIDEVERVTGERVDIVNLPMRPGEDERSIVLADPVYLDVLGIKASDFVTLETGVAHTVAYFDDYLQEEAAA